MFKKRQGPRVRRAVGENADDEGSMAEATSAPAPMSTVAKAPAAAVRKPAKLSFGDEVCN